MFAHLFRFVRLFLFAAVAHRTLPRLRTFLPRGIAVLLLAPAAVCLGQANSPQSTPSPAAERQPSDQTRPPAVTPELPASATATQRNEPAPAITEDELRAQLVGKDLFLRGGYLDNTLVFNEDGVFTGHSPQGSYTLCGIRILKVRVLKHKVELEGQRYGLHFLGALPSEDPTRAVDRVNITPKKKVVRITIDRELVVKSRQQRHGKKDAPTQTTSVSPAPTIAAAPNLTSTNGQSDAADAQAESATLSSQERSAGAKRVAAMPSQAHANQVLLGALSNIFAQAFDARMMASMPDFWKLYYEAVDDRSDDGPGNSSVLSQNMVDRKARLIATPEPASNQFAQDYGVAGMAQYHVVVGADGKARRIVVARPIGFGLDENAVDSIRKASFAPAIKDGKPAPVMLDMSFVFRIYSKRTNVESKVEPERRLDAASLPGPFSLHP